MNTGEIIDRRTFNVICNCFRNYSGYPEEVTEKLNKLNPYQLKSVFDLAAVMTRDIDSIPDSNVFKELIKNKGENVMNKMGREEIRGLVNQYALMNVSEALLNDIEILTRNDVDEVKTFIDALKQDNWVIVAMSKYRESLRQQGRGNVVREEIEQAYLDKDLELLRELLMESSLEYISERDIKYMLKFDREGNIDFNNILDLHYHGLEQGKRDRLICLVTKTYRS